MPERDLKSNPVLPDILTLAYIRARNDITAVNATARNETINALYMCYGRARAMLPFEGSAHGFFTRLSISEEEIYGAYDLSNIDYPALLRKAYVQTLEYLPSLTAHQRETARRASERYKAETEDISLRDFMLPAESNATQRKPIKRKRKYFNLDLKRFGHGSSPRKPRPRVRGFTASLLRFFEDGAYNAGRSPVSEFIWPAITVGMALILTIALFPMTAFNISTLESAADVIVSTLWVMSLFWLLICAIPFIELCIRRMHDLNMRAHGLLALPILLFVPIVKGAVLMVWLMLMLSSGTKGENRFGADPLSF